jgi:uncharacterized protein YndB with AHSA1/START domain
MPADRVHASVHIAADPARVFTYFTQPDAMVQWMGSYAHLEAVPGGVFAVDVEGVAVRGRYLEIDPPHRLLFSWGHAGSEQLPPGSSTVEVVLRAEHGGTQVEVTHRDLPEPEARRHEAGWHHFLGQLVAAASNVDRASGDDNV